MSKIVDLQAALPQAPPGFVNVVFQQAATPSGVDAFGNPIYPTSAYVADPVSEQGTHSEPLTDGNGNFIFAATLTKAGDVICCVGIPN